MGFISIICRIKKKMCLLFSSKLRWVCGKLYKKDVFFTGLRIRIRSDPECFARIRIRNYYSGSGSDTGEEEGRKF